MTTSNPLSKYFRQPVLSITLPSEGNFYPTGAVDIPANGELPVYPMTAIDEITYRTPDALFNGSATVDVIKSCVPNILDPWAMPNVDFDTVLIGIRMASYGHTMEIESVCPHCNHENEFDLDLRHVLGRITSADYSEPLRIDELEIYFRPLSYKQLYDNQTIQTREQQALMEATKEETPEEIRVDALNNILKKLSSLSIDTIVNYIAFIKVGDDTVTSPEYIKEYVSNADKTVFKRIRNKITELKGVSETKPLNITCQNPECKKEYESPFTLDAANFFGQDS